MSRAIADIASDIIRDWQGIGKGVHYSAMPYLEAMLSLDSINDNYGADTARSVVAYGLGNMKYYKGEKARKLKAELKAILEGE